jgi:hypothetical protein
VLSRKSGSRVWLRNIDRLILVWLYRLFPSILDASTVVKPETVIQWHRRGFRACWRRKSRQRGGRPKIDSDIRDLIRRMSEENPLWGAPRNTRRAADARHRSRPINRGEIHDQASEAASQGWKTFLRNHAA